MKQNQSRLADVRTTPSHLHSIEDALDRLADLDRAGAPQGMADRIERATVDQLHPVEMAGRVDRAEPPVVLFRFTSLRAAAAVAFLATSTAVWLAMRSGGLGGGMVEPDLDDWDLFASVSFPPLDYTSDDLFADTEQFTISLTADTLESEPLFDEDSM